MHESECSVHFAVSVDLLVNAETGMRSSHNLFTLSLYLYSPFHSPLYCILYILLIFPCVICFPFALPHSIPLSQTHSLFASQLPLFFPSPS